MSLFYVQVQQIEHNPMRQISKTTIVDNEAFSSIDHLLRRSAIYTARGYMHQIYLYIVEILLLHGLKVRYPSIYAPQIVFHGIVGIPVLILRLSLAPFILNLILSSLTSGEDILTDRTFSSMIRGSLHMDSIKRVCDLHQFDIYGGDIERKVPLYDA